MSIPPVFRAGHDSEKAKAQFQATPWALKLLNDPSLRPFANESRVVHSPKNTADTLVGTSK